MAMKVRNMITDVAFAMAKAWNLLKVDLSTAGSQVHADRTSTASGGDFQSPNAETELQVTAGNGDGTVPTLITLCQNLFDVYQGFTHVRGGKGHLGDDLAHKGLRALPALTRPTATSTLANCETFLNALHTDYTAHIASTADHYAADATNTDASIAATDQASSDTRANALKVALNAHIKMAFKSPSLDIIPA